MVERSKHFFTFGENSPSCSQNDEDEDKEEFIVDEVAVERRATAIHIFRK